MFAPQPSDKSLGYFRASLRDVESRHAKHVVRHSRGRAASDARGRRCSSSGATPRLRMGTEPLNSAAMSWKVLITARTMNEVGASALQLLRDAGCDLIIPPVPGPFPADE